MECDILLMGIRDSWATKGVEPGRQHRLCGLWRGSCLGSCVSSELEILLPWVLGQDLESGFSQELISE